MFRNLYDNDVTVISPQGRLFQVEYAMEAVKQGAAAVGVSSSQWVVLVALKRSPGELASYQKKLISIDDHIGMAIAGLTSDARVLTKYMQSKALNSRLDMNRPIPVLRLVTDISDRAQSNTQEYGGRPFGVGLLIAGFDETGAHLYEFSPSGNFNEFYAMAIGARSQSARTYLEKHVGDFQENGTLDDLIVHALRALRETLPPDQQASGLTAQNTAIGYLGKDRSFQEIRDEGEVQSWLNKLPPVPVRAVPTTAETSEPGNEGAGSSSSTRPTEQEGGEQTMQVDSPPQ